MVVPVKTNSRAQNQISYSKGLVHDVSGNLATVTLDSGLQVRVRIDLQFGRSPAAREGDTWIVAREYGDWRFVSYFGIVPPEVRRYLITLGDGATSSWTIDPGLGTSDVVVQSYDIPSGNALSPTVRRNHDYTLTLTYPSVPAVNSARVVVLA